MPLNIACDKAEITFASDGTKWKMYAFKKRTGSHTKQSVQCQTL